MQLKGEHLANLYELYKITHGTEEWYYTSSDTVIEYDGHIYTPASISRGELSKSTELEGIDLDITVPVADFVLDYIVNVPLDNVFVTIYLYKNASSVDVAYYGKVKNVTLQDDNLSVVSLTDMIETTIHIPRYIITPSCNHYLYDSECGVNKNSYRTNVTVRNIVDNYVYISSISHLDYYKYGYIEFNSDTRIIIETAIISNSYRLELNAPFRNLKKNDVIVCYMGCLKTPSCCMNRFNNRNFLGFTTVPRKNPVTTGL